MNRDTSEILDDAFQSFLDDHAKGQGFSEDTDKLWSDFFTAKSAELVYEAHARHQDSVQIGKHLREMFNMCEDKKSERKFLNTLAESTGMDTCTEKDFTQCAERLAQKDFEDCNTVIESLEEQVGYLNPDDALNEEWRPTNRGTVVVNKETGQKGVILASDGDDINVAPIKGNTPLFRSPKLWRGHQYRKTNDKVKVPDHAPGGKKVKPADSESDED